jgi:hypothetical protein
MKRAVVIGNSGGGKSTLARRLGAAWKCRHVEIDGLLWRPEWQLTPVEIYHAEHARLIAEENWIVDGLGRLESIPERLARATDIILVDMPLWVHFWLAAERQIEWSTGTIENPPACRLRRRCSGRSGRSIKTGCRKSVGSSHSKKSAENGFFGSTRLPNSTSSKIGRERHRRSRCALSSALPLARGRQGRGALRGCCRRPA